MRALRRWPGSAALATAAVVAGVVAGCVAAQQGSQKSAPQAQVIAMTAEKFKYTPDEITVKKGVPVDLVLSTKDRLHGFRVPQLGLRAEIQPGQQTHVKFTPDKVGKYVMECDIFCGSGHEEMDGTITVTE